jgi:predicted Zn-dependent protease
MIYQGFWNDGQSARRQEVRVRLVGRDLVLTGADDRPLLSLPVGGLRLTEEVYADRPLRFSHERYPDARLTVDDHTLLERLRPLAPGLGRRYLAGRGTLARMLVWGGALAATVAAAIVGVPLAARPLAHAVPVQWETAFGEGVVNSMLSGDRECRSPAGVAALDRLVARLSAADEQSYPFTVRVIADDTVNAYAAPGGHIVILDGLLQKAESPQVLAAVLAHEMAHVIERHPTQAIIRRTGYQLMLTSLTGDLSSALGLVAESGQLLLNLAHSRGDEADADDRAIDILQAAGVDSTGLSAFFTQLSTQQDAPPETLRLLSTHPLHDERIAQARSRERPGQPAMTAEEWAALRAICPE